MRKIKHPFFKIIILKELLRTIFILKIFNFKRIKKLKIVWDDFLSDETGGCFYQANCIIGINSKYSCFFKEILRHELAHFFVGHTHGEHSAVFQKNLFLVGACKDINLTSKTKGV